MRCRSSINVQPNSPDITRRTHDMLPHLPDQISIFRGPIMRIARTRHEAVGQIRDTVIHELGHYFGLHDHEMPY